MESLVNQATDTPTQERRSGYALGRHLVLRHPIMQAPLGHCDGPRLAGAVSRAGALGCLTVHSPSMSTLKRQLQQVRQITSRPIILAFTAQWERDEILDYCLEIGQRFFQVFWWNAPRQIARIRHAGGVVLVQVGSASQAQEAVETGADVLVVQGTEAGGPVRSPYPLRQLITEVAMVTEEKVPIIAGGGLADARDVRDVLSWGASVAMLGTRFLLSEEAYASDRHKAMLRRAKTNQLLLDPRLVGDWPCAPRRRLMTLRNEDTPELFAGRGLSKIQEVLPVVEILRQLSPSKSLCQR